MGCSGGEKFATPIKEALVAAFYKVPEYLGPESAVNLVTEGGKRMAEVGGQMVEVVVAGAAQVASAPVPIEEGVYIAGTGNTGAASTFFTLGVAYFIVMIIASFSYRVPREGWLPKGWTPPTADTASKRMITQKNVNIEQALKTPQFSLNVIELCFNVSASNGVLGVVKTMMIAIMGTTSALGVYTALASTEVARMFVLN